MLKMIAACAVLFAMPVAALAQTPGTSAAASDAISTATTSIGDLLDNPQTKAILLKHLPDVVGSDQIEMARGMTFRDIQQFAPGDVTDAKLAAIDADIAALKAGK